MVVAHRGCGGSSGGDLEGDGGGSCSFFPSKLLSESSHKVILNKAAVKAIKEEVARVKTEQVTLFDNACSVSGGSSCDFELEGEGHDDVFSEDSERKNSGIAKEDTVEGVHIKEQVDDAEGSDRCYEGVNGSSSSSSIELPKPMEGLHEVGPPPFLKKTFEMVEDPETDPIVSWSESRDSFVVWDSHEFSKIILPKYFKHSNFSSFIRQLNTYGFRKVDSDRWQFANEGFQGGMKHLLKNIRRRSKYNKLHEGALNSMKPGLEVELEKLKKDQNILKVEILKMRQEQENSHIQLTNVQERIRCAEMKQYQMLFFLTRMARKPTLVEHLIQKIKRKRELDGIDMVKRRRLLGTQYPVSFPKAMETNPNVDYRHQGHDQFATLQSEFTGLLSETVNTSMMEPPAPSVSSAYHVMSEKLLGKNSVVDEEMDQDVNDSNIYLELEDLISKPVDWIGSASGLVGQTS